jgi:hypothetical protein
VPDLVLSYREHVHSLMFLFKLFKHLPIFNNLRKLDALFILFLDPLVQWFLPGPNASHLLLLACPLFELGLPLELAMSNFSDTRLQFHSPPCLRLQVGQVEFP